MNPKSYLTRFLGLHSVKFHGEQIFLVVMNNVFDTKNPIHKRYDIKVTMATNLCNIGRDRG